MVSSGPEAITAIAILVLGALVPGCGKRHEPAVAQQLPPVAVRVQAVENKTHVATEEVVGTVRARLRASVESRISGRIEKLPVVAGDTVKAGQLLAELNAREFQARLDQALAQREQARSDFKRIAALLEAQAVTRSEFDAVQARHRVADAAAAEAETMLAYGKITAPFDGVITRKFADVGDMAAPGKALVELESPAALRLEADVPETIIERVQRGQELKIRVAGIGHELTGVVSEMAPTADAVSRTFPVRLDLPSTPGLRTGQFGRVLIPTGESQSPRVPATAVVQRGQLEIVFVVTDRRAQLRLVKTGKRFGDEIELLSGLNVGEHIVVEGANGLLDGQPVEVR